MNINTKEDKLFKFLKWFYGWKYYEYPKNRCSYFWLSVYAIAGIPFILPMILFTKVIEKLVPDDYSREGVDAKSSYIVFLTGFILILFIISKESNIDILFSSLFSYVLVTLGICILPLIFYFVGVGIKKIKTIFFKYPRVKKVSSKESLIVGYLKDFKNKSCTLITYE